MGHRHRANGHPSDNKTIPFLGCVAPRRCDEHAHGGVAIIENCKCGAFRVINSNGGRLEVGEWEKPMVDKQTGYDDEQDRVGREDERIREQRWADFVSWARQGRTVVLLRHVSDIMEGFSDPFRVYPAIAEILSGFAQTEGWDGVLNAIARAYREEQDAQKKG